jgi:NADH-quinone oxidoreductase subunit D
VLRLVLELEGETVTEARCGIGFLHTGIEKNLEYRSWTQGVTFVTRMDYLSNAFNEVVYCLGVEKLLGITDEVPERATTIRVMLMELQRIASHLVAIATGGMEIGALTVMTIGFREREEVLDIFEKITGERMNFAYVRPGGLAQDLPPGTVDHMRTFLTTMKKRIKDYEDLCNENPVFRARLDGVGYLDLAGCMSLGITGPVLRPPATPGTCARPSRTAATRTTSSRSRPGTPSTRTAASASASRRCTSRFGSSSSASTGSSLARSWSPTARSAGRRSSRSGRAGSGNSPDHIRHIMGESMEALIHHFKLVTEGFRVPPGQAYVAVESPRGELGRPRRQRRRNPPVPRPLPRPRRSPTCSASAAMCEGSQIADVIAAVASIDPVMGGVDR